MAGLKCGIGSETSDDADPWHSSEDVPAAAVSFSVLFTPAFIAAIALQCASRSFKGPYDKVLLLLPPPPLTHFLFVS